MKLPWVGWNVAGWQDTRVRANSSFATYAGINFESQAHWDPLSRDNISTLARDFHFNTSYLQLNCNPPALANISDFPRHTLPSTNYTINMTTTPNPDDSLEFNIWERYNQTAITAGCAAWTQQVEIKGHWSVFLPFVLVLVTCHFHSTPSRWD